MSMSENVVIYAGLEKAGELKKKAIQQEANRKAISVSDLVWSMLRRHGSAELKADLAAADKMK